MPTDRVPDEAVEAAAISLYGEAGPHELEAVRPALEAALPSLLATEREARERAERNALRLRERANGQQTRAEKAESRLAALPEDFKAEFGAAGRVERVEVVLRWLEEQTGKEKP